MSEVPKPNESGTSGSQREGSASTAELHILPPTHGLSLGQTIGGLAASRSRMLGGDVSAQVLAVSFRKLEHDIDQLNLMIKEKDQEIRGLRNDLESERVKNATLRSDRNSSKKSVRLRQFGIFAGTVILGVAVDLFKSNIPNLPYILFITGVVLVALSWWAPNHGGEE